MPKAIDKCPLCGSNFMHNGTPHNRVKITFDYGFWWTLYGYETKDNKKIEAYGYKKKHAYLCHDCAKAFIKNTKLENTLKLDDEITRSDRFNEFVG